MKEISDFCFMSKLSFHFDCLILGILEFTLLSGVLDSTSLALLYFGIIFKVDLSCGILRFSGGIVQRWSLVIALIHNGPLMNFW